MNKYAEYSSDHLENLFSEFLIDSWSYSKVSTFARNEKAFEMQYIYGYQSKQSTTSIAGSAYHYALKHFFEAKKSGETIDLASLESHAFSYIDSVDANRWKIQKTLPTVEECKQKALKTVSALLKNFCSECNLYLDLIDEILEVELRFEEFLVVNGVDIPLPCHAVADLIVSLKDGRLVIIDHKSMSVFSTDEELTLTAGRQAITYILCLESLKGVQADEVWFIENKHSQNKDGSPQLHKFALIIDENTRKLYEALLYEPLKRMLQAVNDPDYVYIINDNDNFVDMAEIYTFWAKTMIAEVEDFNIADTKKELISKRLKKIRDTSIATVNPKLIKTFQENASKFIQYDLSDKNMTQEEKIQHVLRSFGLIVNVAHKFDGYSSNSYLLEISAGVKITSIHSHKLDIANALDVSNVRLSKDLVVYEGKSYLSIEVSKKRERDLLFDPKEIIDYKIPLGRDNYEQNIYWDLSNHSTPHVLVCGATGSGKSVLLRSTLEYANLLDMDMVVVLDPKYEFKKYSFYKNFLVLNDIEDIENQMNDLVNYMNTLVKEGKTEKILIIFDEFADALSASRKGSQLDIYSTVVTGFYRDGREKTKREKTGELKSLEENLRILLQKGRSSGFRIMAATQRASVKVITGDAKVNFPIQICFRVPKEIDSKVVIDEGGAESLAGMGDGLIKSPEYKDIVRFQAYYKP